MNQQTALSNWQPLISVVLVTYNGAAFITQQLATVVEQTYKNLEIIILDNASTDNTCSLVTAFAEKDNRIKLYFNNENNGANKGFEQALHLSKGKLIALCDQDDVWELNKIEVMMAAWTPDTKYMFSRPGQFINDKFDQRKTITGYDFKDVTDARMLVFHTPVSGHATLFCRTLLQSCPPFNAAIYHDWWLSMHTVLQHNLTYCPATLTWQRIHGGNSSLQVYQLSKKDKQAKLRQQWIAFIQAFLSSTKSKTPATQSLAQYLAALQQINGSRFCWPMFWYVLKNRQWVFHYKKKPFVFISHIKHAFKMAKSGV